MTDTAKRMTFPNPSSSSSRDRPVSEEHDRRRAGAAASAGRPDRHGDDATSATARLTGCTTTSPTAAPSRTCATVAGCWNGPRSTGTCTERRSTRSAASGAGRDAILTIDPQGARQVRARVPDALLIFVMPPSMEDLTQRLRDRGSESEASLERRRTDAERWIAESGDYDHVVVNETGRPAEAADRIWDIIHAEARRDRHAGRGSERGRPS